MECDSRTVELEEGWRFVATSLAKFRCAIDGDGEGLFADEYMKAFTTVYCMCTQAAPHNYAQQLYQRYRDDLDGYIKSTVLLPLREMHGEALLRGLVERWGKHNLIIDSEIKLLRYLHRYYISKTSLPPLKQLSSTVFRDLVFDELKGTATRIVISMIDDERERQLIDRDLLKNVLDIYFQLGPGNLVIYKADFELAFLEGTRNYYSRKARTWILEYSDPDYMLKVEECLQNEKERVANYLHSSTEPKLMEVVKSKLITTHAEP